MSIVISVLILIVSVLLMLVVLVQNSKGGGLASNFSSHNQILGAPTTTDFLEKTTRTLAVFLVIFCLASSVMIKNSSANNGPETRVKSSNTATTTETTDTPDAAPLDLNVTE